MTPEQIEKINKLAGCTFKPGSWDKRFVRSLKESSEQTPNKELSVKQIEWVDKLTYKYRRQIP
ncbi:MAG: hypothetical protein F6K31_31660 [Symploca sp. SIO2G7]|nr:hypothetical protein [Symploca sp. SIO2G7]